MRAFPIRIVRGDSVGHTVRVVTDNPEMTVLSIDGIGAYDHVCRACPVCDPSCLSSDKLTHGNRRIGGLMRMGQGIRSGNMKEGNKGTP